MEATLSLAAPKRLLLNYRASLSVVGSLSLAIASYLLAFALRFDLTLPRQILPILLAAVPLLIAAKAVGFWTFSLFSGWWRHVSVRDVEDIARGNLLASTLFLAGMVFLRRLGGFPRSVFLLDLLLCTTAMCGLRLGVRLLRERRERAGVRRIETLVLIVGAGWAGIRLLEEIERRRHLKVAVVGFIDDDPAKLGLRISGTPVLGRVEDIPALVAAHDVGEVLIAIPTATGAALRRIVQRCVEAGVRHRVLPSLGELVEGRVMYTQIREVKVDDLLAREPVKLDLHTVRSLVIGRTVLVTGAAGSIGSELCRQLAAREPGCIVLYDRHENGMFALEMELRSRFPAVRIETILGDVLLPDLLSTVYETYQPELVFHAAAYKHVPMAERNVLEAVRNNVLGTYNVARAAVTHGTREFILVSTDKAVRPASVMGVTKRVAEMVVKTLQNGRCAFVAVRFGNVLGSSGSVIPLFREQIARGGPVTVTDPEVTRYFMTIPEAAQLILEAAALGAGGETFILKMGQPMRILDLARHMIRLSGFEPDEDIEIVFTGLRPGEKLSEELVSDDEEIASTYHDRINVIRATRSNRLPEPWLPTLEERVQAGEVRGTVALLRQLVPSYRPSAFLADQLDATSRATDSGQSARPGDP